MPKLSPTTIRIKRVHFLGRRLSYSILRTVTAIIIKQNEIAASFHLPYFLHIIILKIDGEMETYTRYGRKVRRHH